MNGQYIVFGDLRSLPGVRSKVADQVTALERAGHRCQLSSCSPRRNIAARIVRRVLGIQLWNMDGLRDAQNQDYIYMRRRSLTPGMCWAIWRQRRRNRHQVVLLEIPTYPYDAEVKLSGGRVKLGTDKLCRIFSPLLFDRVVTYSHDARIFRVPTLRISNGVDVARISPKKSRPVTREVNILAVAALAPWHGYDRILAGLVSLESKRDIRLHIVGDGSARHELEAFTRTHGLSSRVHFYGMLSGEALRAVYDKCDVAIGPLGIHRKGLEASSSLKVPEYLACGLPVVIAGFDHRLEKPTSVIERVPLDDDPVDIERLIAFVDELYGDAHSNDSTVIQAREYAKATCDMSMVFSPVTEYLHEAENRSAYKAKAVK